jgi:hypothetical protein
MRLHLASLTHSCVPTCVLGRPEGAAWSFSVFSKCVACVSGTILGNGYESNEDKTTATMIQYIEMIVEVILLSAP